MPAYLSGQALVTACMAGRGVIIIVEGETDEKDAWFYSQWFGDRAAEVSFFPQNGWEKVATAVQTLRAQLPNRHIYGILDRDHTDDATLLAQRQACPVDGLFRTERFTLENHLLDAEAWFAFLQQMNRGQTPAQCASVSAMATLIEEEYIRCIPLSAYNLALCREHERSGADGVRAVKHPQGMPTDPEAELARLQSAASSPLDLVRIFRDQNKRLTGQAVEVLERYVSGKIVLPLLISRLKLSKPQDMLMTFFVTLNPKPPADLAALITRIVDRQGQP